MKGRLTALVTAVVFATAVTAAQPAGAATVSLRVESSAAAAPLFDGSVETLPHEVDGGDGSGPHPCWGPPGATPAATATGALDDAMRSAAIPWRGNWDPSFRDFFIDSIGAYASASPDRYWSLTVNGRFSAGGCLSRVADGDTIRFSYGPLFGVLPNAGDETGGIADGQQDEKPPGKGARNADGGTPPRRLRRIAAAAGTFLRRRGAGESWTRLALGLRRGDGPASGAASLLAGRLDRQRPDGSLDGDVNATALAVLALKERWPRRAGRAGAWLAGKQAEGGGFGYRPGAPADIDTTAMAAWALVTVGREPAVRRAASFIRDSQGSDGGFPAIRGGESNAQSTGLATVALRVSGLGPREALSASGRSPLDYLAGLSRPNGSIAYARRSAPSPVWTTAQALLGLTTKAKLLGFYASGTSG